MTDQNLEWRNWTDLSHRDSARYTGPIEARIMPEGARPAGRRQGDLPAVVPNGGAETGRRLELRRN